LLTLAAPAAQKNVIELLNEARKKIIAELASMDTTRDTRPRSSIAEVLDRAGHGQVSPGRDRRRDRYQKQAAIDGTKLVDAPMTAALGQMPLGQISADTVSIVQGYTADLITGFSKKAAADVNAMIARAFLGGQSSRTSSRRSATRRAAESTTACSERSESVRRRSRQTRSCA
jgi:hypothetical protein